ncbi:MAG: endonuclease/exonuclease/phosphatase family protein [Flavobacteriales bacterium]|nr:endonuclease/exonuclease/phosphatase family protein [Flavobacteriales bacterium]
MKARYTISLPVRTGVMLSVACFLAFAPDCYLPMLARSFLVQWTALFLILSAAFLWLGSWWSAVSAMVGTGLLLMQIPMPLAGGPDPPTGSMLRVLHMNVWQPNERYGSAIEEALSSEADVISIQEVDRHWAVELISRLGPSYPYARIEPRSNCYGIALFSKLPFERVNTMYLDGAPLIEARFSVAGEPVRVISVHATSPISYEHFHRRNRQLEGLVPIVAATTIPTILVGDLNTVPWDGAFGRFCSRSGLRAAPVKGSRTWPSVGPLALIPLDHVLLSGQASATSISSFHVPGSDHRGLLAEIILPRNAP